jgi:molybdopterin synthase sulfur carrier subunit
VIKIKFKVLLFGITRDLAGKSQLDIELEEGSNVSALLEKLGDDFTQLSDLKSLMIAVNNEYAKPDHILKENDEIALIPPVSGG